MNQLEKKRAITGLQPSGKIHLGNYFGAMKPLLEFQESHELFVFVAEYHAMTTIDDPAVLAEHTQDVVLDYLAIGLDPEKTTLYRQSAIPELHELTWILGNQVTLPWLERAHSFKDKQNKGIEARVGLFMYPVLMAADIIMVDAQIVPVGKDQVQHIEMTRELVRKMNTRYTQLFIEPQESVREEVAVVPGTDGQKMSKSYGNTVPLFGTDKEIKKAIMSIVTDSAAPEDPKDPETCNVFQLHKLITPEPQLSEIRTGYREGGLGYGDSKKILLANYMNLIEPMRERRAYYAANPGIVRQILDEGERKVRDLARKKMEQLKQAVGLAL